MQIGSGSETLNGLAASASSSNQPSTLTSIFGNKQIQAMACQQENSGQNPAMLGSDYHSHIFANPNRVFSKIKRTTQRNGKAFASEHTRSEFNQCWNYYKQNLK